MPPNELYHYGVLGMHWGIRRYQPYSTVPRGSGKGGKEIGNAKKSRSASASSTSSTSKVGFFSQRKLKKQQEAKKKADSEKMAKLRQIKAEKAQQKLKEDAEKTSWEEAKKTIITRGDVETAKKYLDQFSNEELDQITRRNQAINSFLQSKETKNLQYTDEENKIRNKIFKEADLKEAEKHSDLFDGNELQSIINKRENIEKIKNKNSTLSKMEENTKKFGRSLDLVLDQADRIGKVNKMLENGKKLASIIQEASADSRKKQEEELKTAEVGSSIIEKLLDKKKKKEE